MIGNRTSEDETPTDQEAIQRELMKNGPVAVGGFKLFEDFFYYKSGVYVVSTLPAIPPCMHTMACMQRTYTSNTLAGEEEGRGQSHRSTC